MTGWLPGGAAPRRALALLAVLALLWAAWSWFQPPGVTNPPRPATPVFTDWSFNPFADGKPLDAVQHNADAAREADEARLRVVKVWESGSLRGSNLDGEWGSFVDGRLQPSFSLRQRFDYLLTALGEVKPSDLRHWIEQEVSAELGLPAARQVLAVWDRYIALQQTSFGAQVNPNDANTWQPALAERTAARRRILGDDWAQAFYADEERTFVAFTADLAAQRAGSVNAADVPPPTLRTEALNAEQSEQLQARRVQQFGAEAAERLRAEDALWADWERRLQAVRERVQALNAAPELSGLQRGQAQEAALAQAFSGTELVRARALLLGGR